MGVQAAVAGAGLRWRTTTAAAARIWLIFSMLRWLTLATTEFVKPGHGQFVDGFMGVGNLPNHFDASWLLGIAEKGYSTDGAPLNRAFFPGYPLLVRILADVLGLGSPTEGWLVTAAVLITSGCSLIATVFVFRIAEEQFGGRAGPFAAVLLMSWPTATFLTAFYSEPTYLALASAAWWGGRHGRWWLAGGLCAGASLTRINGLFLVAALLALLLLRVRQGSERFQLWKAAAIGVGIVGTTSYAVYLRWATGDWDAWFRAQAAGWGRHLSWPWDSLSTTLGRVFHTPDLPLAEVVQHLVDMLTVAAALVFLVYLARRRLWPEFILTLVTLTVLVTSSYYLSIARNTLTIVPVFVVGGMLLSRTRASVAGALLVASTLWMVTTTVLFGFTWAG